MLGHQKWLLYSIAVFGAFVVYRAAQWREAEQSDWGDSLSKAWAQLPEGPPDSKGKGSQDVAQFGLQMLLVLPVLHFARVQ